MTIRSECQFFMAVEDEAEFVGFVNGIPGVTIGTPGHISSIDAFRGSIQFLRSERIGKILTAGRIALATDGFVAPAISASDLEALESLYRKLRRWIQARYTNRLFCFATNVPEGTRKIVPVRTFWLGSKAQRWLESDVAATLRQFRTGNATFVVAAHHANSAA